MRSHRDWPLLQIWARQRQLKSFVSAQNLQLARLEPVVVRNTASAVLDLRFLHQNIGACVPCCIVDRKALETRTQDAIIWPFAVTEMVHDDKLYELEALLIDWLLAESAGTGFTAERIHRFKNEDQSFEAARHARLLGAVSYIDLAQELSAAHYAARFVPGKQVLCAGTLPNVAALLAPSAARTAVIDLDAAELLVLDEWFGSELLTEFSVANPATVAVIAAGQGSYQSHITAHTRLIDVTGTLAGEAITYAPSNALDDLVSLCESSPRALTTRIEPLSERGRSLMPKMPEASGGSDGRLLIVLRDDALRAPGADTDEAFALRRLLCAEGFTVDITVQSKLCDPATYDLIHGFGLLSAPSMLRLFEAAESLGVPTVLTPFFEDVAAGGWWGARASRSLLDLTNDEESAGRIFELLAARLVHVDQVQAHERFDNGDEAARKSLLRIAGLVITHSKDEYDAVAAYAARTQNIAVSLPLVYAEPSTSVAHLVPDQAYMFVHAGIEARENVGLALAAASTLDIPCVFAGPILDRRLYRYMAARVNAHIVLVPECSTSELYSIGQGAAVYIDTAWVGNGCCRILRSLLHGSVPVVAQNRLLDETLAEHVIRVDPASLHSLRNAMSEAWQRAGTLPCLQAQQALHALYDPNAVFRSVIAAYATVYEQRNALSVR